MLKRIFTARYMFPARIKTPLIQQTMLLNCLFKLYFTGGLNKQSTHSNRYTHPFKRGYVHLKISRKNSCKYRYQIGKNIAASYSDCLTTLKKDISYYRSENGQHK